MYNNLHGNIMYIIFYFNNTCSDEEFIGDLFQITVVIVTTNLLAQSSDFLIIYRETLIDIFNNFLFFPLPCEGK